MNKILLIFIIIYILPNNTTFAQGEDVFKKVDPSVVVIHTINSEGKVIATGSGVVINKQGYIVTNCHVLGDISSDIIVSHYNKKYFSNSIIYINPVLDILIFTVKDNDRPSIDIANTKDIVSGQKIYAVGSPLGLENTITEGVVSGFRDFGGSKYIQISAPISPGSSGGAVVNEDGELIGISTLSNEAGQNINFAIPIEKILEYKEQYGLKFNSEITRNLHLKFIGIYTGCSSVLLNNKNENERKIMDMDYLKNTRDTLIKIREDNPYWKVYNSIGLSYFLVKKYEDGINYLIIAKRMGDPTLLSNLVLAISFEALGDLISAENFYNIAAENGNERSIDWLEKKKTKKK